MVEKDLQFMTLAPAAGLRQSAAAVAIAMPRALNRLALL